MIDLNLSNRTVKFCSLLDCGNIWDDDEREEAIAWIELHLDSLTAWAGKNDVLPILFHSLDALGAKNIPIEWREAHEKTARRITAYLVELDRIAVLFKEMHIPLVALKNSGIVRGILSCSGCSPMGDVDVLVEKQHFLQGHRILVDDGYCFEFRSPLEEAEVEAAKKSGGAEYWKVLPGGEKFWLELQWRPVAGRWIRPDQEPSTKALMARSLAIPGTAVRLLAPEDNLLQVALHTAKHSYVRAPGFRLHLDVHRIVLGQKIDWDVFIQRVVQFQVKTPVFFSLAIPKVLFQTPVPAWVLERIQPPSWKRNIITRWLQRVGLFNPDERKFSRIGYIFFTALLYDDVKGLLRGIFPEREWMQGRYGLNSAYQFPLFYLKRLMNLAFKRENT